MRNGDTYLRMGECREVYPEVTWPNIVYNTNDWDLEIALGKIEVPVKNSEGEFRGLKDILEDVADSYNELTKR